MKENMKDVFALFIDFSGRQAMWFGKLNHGIITEKMKGNRLSIVFASQSGCIAQESGDKYALCHYLLYLISGYMSATISYTFSFFLLAIRFAPDSWSFL